MVSPAEVLRKSIGFLIWHRFAAEMPLLHTEGELHEEKMLRWKVSWLQQRKMRLLLEEAEVRHKEVRKRLSRQAFQRCVPLR